MHIWSCQPTICDTCINLRIQKGDKSFNIDQTGRILPLLEQYDYCRREGDLMFVQKKGKFELLESIGLVKITEEAGRMIGYCDLKGCVYFEGRQ
jgi:hypothetical protein